MSQLLFNGLVIGMSYALIAVGLTIIFGILGIVNFAHGEFYMLGAYALFTFQNMIGTHYLVGALLSILTIAAIAFLIEYLTLRPLQKSDHLNSLLATFALSIILTNVVQIIYTATPRQIAGAFNQVVEIGGIFATQQKLLVIIVSALIILGLALFMKFHGLGKLMRAVSQNHMGAMVCGIPIKRIYSVSFVIGIVLSATAGILIGPTTYATPTMGTLAMLKGFVVVILGGLGSVPGAVVGGMILGIAETLGSSFFGNAWKDLVGFVLLVAVLLIYPQGLFGFKRREQ